MIWRILECRDLDPLLLQENLEYVSKGVWLFLANNLQPGFLFKIGWVETFMSTKTDGER